MSLNYQSFNFSDTLLIMNHQKMMFLRLDLTLQNLANLGCFTENLGPKHVDIVIPTEDSVLKFMYFFYSLFTSVRIL